ncbi:MAG: hypothetical protein PQJ28_03400, partial [Spirochaetales bacterium]|nr:hypothetical protein [Spirochaetales bacterium]
MFINVQFKTSLLLIMTFCFISTSALAHNATTDVLYLEAVTVKAQKRTQNAQDVPASIAALDDVDLKDMDIKDTDDLALHVPNLEFSDFGSRRHGFMFLRGIKSLPNAEPATGYFVDGGLTGGVYKARER